MNLLALAIWLGSRSSSPICVVRVFMTMEKLSPRLDAYAQYGGEHWRSAPGRSATASFITDIIQFVAGVRGPLVRGLVVIRAANPASPLDVGPGPGAVGRHGLAMGMMLIVGSLLNAHFRKHWDAAAAGKTGRPALAGREAAKLHPTSGRNSSGSRS